MHFVFIITALFVFGGCAHKAPDFSEALQKAPVKTFRTLRAKRIVPDSPVKFDLADEKAETIIQEGKKTFAKKLTFTPLNEPFSLKIETRILYGYFAPKLFFLDQSGRILKSVGADALRLDRGRFKGTVFVNEHTDKIGAVVITQDLHSRKDRYCYQRVYVFESDIALPSGGRIPFQTASGDKSVCFDAVSAAVVHVTLEPYRLKSLKVRANASR